MTVIVPTRGSLAIRHPDLPEAVVDPGDVAIIPTISAYDVTPVDGDRHAAPLRILPEGRCADEHGHDLSHELRLDTRLWGTRRGGSHAFITGSYNTPDQLGGLIIDRLDRIVTAPAPQHLVGMLTDELSQDRPGQAAVLDRLVDLLLASALRSWFADHPHQAPVAWNAQQDAVIGPVLDLIHQSPAHPWTLTTLAAGVGWSRATVARRFTQLVGEPPIRYLTQWRMTLAADALHRTDHSIAHVARDVGYQNPYAFSTAFTRHHGHSPRHHRTPRTDAATSRQA